MPLKVSDYGFILHTHGGHEVVFEIANEDNTSAVTQYYGYLSSYGSWIIQKSTVIADTNQYTYAAGKTGTDYTACWNVTTGVYEGSATFTTFDQIKDNLT